MKFCKKCGSQIPAGQVCNCATGHAVPQATGRQASSIQPHASPTRTSQGLPPHQTNPPRPPISPTSYGSSPGAAPHMMPHAPMQKAQPSPRAAKKTKTKQSGAGAFFEDMLIRMGIYEPNTYATDPSEIGMPIVPDCIVPTEGEIPVKQYNVATMSNLNAQAEGRLQVTNKRVIFRATSSAYLSRATQHNEFAIDDIAGVSTVRNTKSSFILMILGFLVLLVGAWLAVTVALFAVPDQWTERDQREVTQDDGSVIQETFDRQMRQFVPPTESVLMLQGDIQRLGLLGGILSLIMGLGGLVPFFTVKKRFFYKLFMLGISLGGVLMMAARWDIAVLLIVVLVPIAIAGLYFCSLVPEMILTIKSKGAAPTIDVRSTTGGVIGNFMGAGTDSCFASVVPTEETDEVIRELGAIISDIQKLGDYGVNKWL